MKLPISILSTFTKISWSAGLFGLHKPATALMQRSTYRIAHPVKRYASVEEITLATSKLKWTEDPWNGKMDIVKHPTFMQEAIDSHPDYAGDCDDYAMYWIVALRKSGLAKDAFMASVLWEDSGDISGHACCVFSINGQWYWVSNWYKCVPQKIDTMYGWMNKMLEQSKKKCVVAGRYEVEKILDDDTVIFGPAWRCK